GDPSWAAEPQTPVISGVTMKARRGPDTTVRAGAGARRNYGTAPTMELRSSSRDLVSEAYLQFEMSELDPTLTNATLWVYAMLDTPGQAAVQVRSFAPVPLSETEVAWSNRPEHISPVARFDVTGVSPVWYQVDVTRY